MTEAARLDGYGKRVLVVEAHAPVRDLLLSALMRNGYNAYEATDRFEALATMGRRRYDAVLADCCFSQPGDVIFIRICRQRWPERPMIVLASEAHGPADVVAGLYACLPKPFDLYQVLCLVRQATHGEPAPARDTGVELAGIS
ncbi:Response regulator [Nitrospira tepida]|uniref:Response regulator n=1 Tax=Nitrospira tepida TaxID=2973512 RepID=A0AA86N1C4_9BACT|nr:response regulator [Nitrospira tepida]CAI4032831.1 Response regulator [Nitrospira tepida]